MTTKKKPEVYAVDADTWLRSKGWKITNERGQIFRRCGGDEGKLFSENLY